MSRQPSFGLCRFEIEPIISSNSFQNEFFSVDQVSVGMGIDTHI